MAMDDFAELRDRLAGQDQLRIEVIAEGLRLEEAYKQTNRGAAAWYDLAYYAADHFADALREILRLREKQSDHHR